MMRPPSAGMQGPMPPMHIPQPGYRGPGPTSPSASTSQIRPPMPPGGMSSARSMQNMQAGQIPFGRPPSSAGSYQQMQPPLAGPSHSPVSANRPVNGFGPIGIGSPGGSQSNKYGMSSLGAPFAQQQQNSGMNTPSTIGRGFAPTPTSGMSPIGPPPRSHSTAPGPVGAAASSLAALNLGSQPVQRKVSAEPPNTPGAIGARRASLHEKTNGLSTMQPIGPPKSQDDDKPASSGSSLRSPSPPPILGSSALLDDYDDTSDTPSSPAQSSSFQSSSFGGAMWGDQTWSAPAAAAPAAPSRNDIIRVSCSQSWYIPRLIALTGTSGSRLLTTQRSNPTIPAYRSRGLSSAFTDLCRRELIFRPQFALLVC